MISPSSTLAADYATGTLTAAACPTLDDMWMATSTPLPPAPNAALCGCLVDTLDCQVLDSTSSDAYADIFNYVCGNDTSACTEILKDGSTGIYGTYSGCNPEQQLDYVMNEWYMAHDSSSTACAFSGQATIVSAAAATGTCSSLLAEASGGTVASPTAKASSTTSSGTGSSSASTSSRSSSASATSKGAAPGSHVPSAQFGLFQVGLYILGALVTGVGMIVL